ncbi:MAG: DUF1232 domain-containing protein [Myxococcales bacterium]|nr:DUF1232 domain-containing protein [Myxococcales bacterium]MCB9715134.1 DUF1232 domain-containing protein [Myxococcales bacterium]
MPAMLSGMIDQTTAELLALEVEREAEPFAHTLLERRAEAFAELPGGAAGDVARGAARRLARKQISLLRELPEMIATLAASLEDATHPPALRLMQAGALAYLVDPRDLLPDDLPGGYGFVDDAIVLRAMVVSVPQLYTPDPARMMRERRVLDFHGLCIPRELVPALVRSVRGSTTMVQTLGALPPALLEASLRELLDDPLRRIRTETSEEEHGGWGVQPATWFRIDDGVVEALGGDDWLIRLDRESGVALVGDELQRH